mmetsp:Transcript_8943/g.20679  ORF Transcript_8943/g.20679 Transcript_8943/m.20679 type:complete len:287 (+) Transcript_8943:615-1475(+)|eukprot:CAMPEP_0116830390 /NCGR_PEP_ID=MMETSP0418-20121206/4736_1 /TAXON_ID=1158023 /ORGANISM="Astrosyne radiata, Strain 13vi08-1A" /LENGTH=286 /DNA_ID=CAMNT_0004459487 /DNA_START=483 /DNA_END=1343 /DNA_ORIENTATION=+
MDDTENDDGSIEGAIVRNLFCTESDSEEETTTNNHETTNDNDKTQQQPVFRKFRVMDIWLEEQCIGGSIAQRLWPAAEYLANFCMKQWNENHDSSSMNVGGNLFFPTSSSTTILELGAGLGLTGLQLATQFPCRLILTDLPDAMPLLRRNVQLNQEAWRQRGSNVSTRVLEWGKPVENDIFAEISDNNLLILASDCVYWESLYEPLERTLAQLLSSSLQQQPSRFALLASVRRWKRDNTFFHQLGKKTKTKTHSLICTCVHGHVDVNDDDGKRQVMKIHHVQWKAK